MWVSHMSVGGRGFAALVLSCAPPHKYVVPTRVEVGTCWWWLWAVLRGLLSDSSAACVLEQTASFVALDPALFQWLALPRCSPTCRTFFSECTDSRVRRAEGKQGAMCTFTCCLASQGCGAVLRCHTCTLRP